MFYVIICVLLNIETAVSAGNSYDVSSGSVFPSKNSSIIDNPSAMNLGEGDAIEVLLGFPDSGGPDVVASYSGDFDKIGFGMMFYKNTVNNYIYGALSAEANDFFRIGLSGYFETESGNASGDLGFRFGREKGLSGAIVVRDFVGGFNLFTFGIAYALGSTPLIIEADSNYSRGANTMDMAIRMTFLGTSFNLNLGYHFMINPRGTHSSENIEAGASFWLTRDIAFIFLYHHIIQPDDIMLGIKLAF
ncbi:MAG: hypothetical protein JXA66_06645 [Oligoflexia bacterium]|nr:hypothetical protein [Oligoflexia bacterium]